MREYDLIAEWYASARLGQTGIPEATALAQSIASGGRILDIGCGNGIPITRALLSAGHRVVGLDSSSEMLARFRANCPESPAIRGVVQASPFSDHTFDAAVAWGVMFHLDPYEATAAIASVSRVLKAGAPFLFTSGDVEGGSTAKEDTMNGVVFRYFSLSVDGYRHLLRDHGLALVDVHADSGKNTCYLARKSE